MNKIVWLICCTPLLLAACAELEGGVSSGSANSVGEAPENIRAIAGPNQNLSTVGVDPVDGCYVYQYVGPVETTFLPLLSSDGRPICTRAPDEAT